RRRAGTAQARRARAAVLRNHRRRLLRASGRHQRLLAARGPARAGDRRPRRRDGIPRRRARSGDPPLPLVRLPLRVRTARGNAHVAQAGGSACRSARAAEHAMTARVIDFPMGDADARRAISEDLDTTLIVEAAAGTGKTTELIKRILQVLKTGRAAM